MNNWAILHVGYSYPATGVTITSHTNNPCHLWCYYTDVEPVRHPMERTIRGLKAPWGAYYCFVAWKKMEQLEPGDTLIHTFPFDEWPLCQELHTEPHIITTTIERRVAADNDECRVFWDGTQWKYDFAHHETVPGHVVATLYKSGYGMIFRYLPIPIYSIIVTARVLFEAFGDTPNPGIRTFIGSELNSAPNPFFSLVDYWARSRTPNPIKWDDIEPWFAEGIYYSRDIASHIQSVIDLPTWDELDHICLFWQDHDGRSDFVDYTTRMAETHHHDPTHAPKLVVEYYVPPARYTVKKAPSRWFLFSGTVGDVLSPSVSAIFRHCRPLPLSHKYEYFDASYDTGLYTKSDVKIAQTFTPQTSHYINQVRLLLRRKANPGMMWLYIEPTTPAGVPTDTILTGIQFDANGLPTGAPPNAEWLTIDFTPFPLLKDTKYAIVIAGGDDDNGVAWNAESAGGYPRGNICWTPSGWGGAWWQSPWDFLFEEWGEPI